MAQKDLVNERDFYAQKEVELYDVLKYALIVILANFMAYYLVSCIYSLGNPIDYRNMVISLRTGMEKNRDDLIRKLVDLQYERNDINFRRTSGIPFTKQELSHLLCGVLYRWTLFRSFGECSQCIRGV